MTFRYLLSQILMLYFLAGSLQTFYEAHCGMGVGLLAIFFFCVASLDFSETD